jgi:hypothetical protein
MSPTTPAPKAASRDAPSPTGVSEFDKLFEMMKKMTATVNQNHLETTTNFESFKSETTTNFESLKSDTTMLKSFAAKLALATPSANLPDVDTSFVVGLNKD